MSISENENHEPDRWHVKGKFASDTDETMRSMHIVRDQRGELVAAFVTKQDAITGATAPELLEVLKSAIHELSEWATAFPDDGNGNTRDVLDIAEAVIAKAEGRADQ